MDEIKSYAYYIKAGRPNKRVPGFHFDVDMFENLIDCWTPEDSIPTLLQTTKSKLDKFCLEIYNMPFHDTYLFLSGITDAFMRKTFKSLATAGNATALNTVAEHFMKLKSDNSTTNNITIINDLKED